MARISMEAVMARHRARVAEHNEMVRRNLPRLVKPEIVDVSVTPQRDRDGRAAWVVGEYQRNGENVWHTVHVDDVSTWHPGGRR